MAKLIEKRELPNGLILNIWDESKHLFGDRWYVGIRATVAVPLPEKTPGGLREEVIEAMRKKLGSRIYFQALEERNFISEDEVEILKEELKAIFLQNSLSYLSHRHFAQRFLILKAEEAHKKMLMGEEYLAKFLEQLKGPEVK